MSADKNNKDQSRDAAGTGANSEGEARSGLVKRRGYAGRSAEQLSAERRQRLLDAALELFSQRGYLKTPIEILCSHAKVTTRHFYEHFESREAVLLALYDEISVATRNEVIQSLRDAQHDPETRVYAAVRAFIAAFTKDPRKARISCIEVVGVSTELAQRRRATVNEFADLLNSFAKVLIEARVVPDRDYRPGCVGLVGATIEMLTEWLTCEKPSSVEDLTVQLLRIFAAIIAGAKYVNVEGLAKIR